MDPGALLGRGLGFPPRVGPDGRLVWSAGAQNIRESIRIILSTEQQERLMLGEFGAGLAACLFEPNDVATRHRLEERITLALARWEPRIAVESVSVEADPEDARTAIAVIAYRLVATQTRERTTLTVTLAG